jgi:hypothetical protein
MIEDMAARKLNPHTQRSHIQSCPTSRDFRALAHFGGRLSARHLSSSPACNNLHNSSQSVAGMGNFAV